MSFYIYLGMDAERGTVTSGGRGYYLMGPAVCLQQALIQLAMQVSICYLLKSIINIFYIKIVKFLLKSVLQFDEIFR